MIYPMIARYNEPLIGRFHEDFAYTFTDRTLHEVV